MGEVYRARDSRLGRDVAVKVSKEQFNQIMQYLQEYPQKHDDIRRALVALRPEQLVIPKSEGGYFKTPYRTLFAIPYTK